MAGDRHVNLNYSSLAGLIWSLLEKKNITSCQLAQAIGNKQAIVDNWLNGNSIPAITDCRKLAEFAELSLSRILSLTDHLPVIIQKEIVELIEFRKNDDPKPGECLGEDLDLMIEDLIVHGVIKEYQGFAKDNGK